MTQFLKMHTVNSDGSPVSDVIACVILHPETMQPLPSVVAQVRPMSPKEHRKIIRANTSAKRGPRGLEEVVDNDAIVDEVVRRNVVSWVGIVGADDAPLACNDQTKAALDVRVKVQLFAKIVGADVVDAEVSEARFPEPA